MNIEEKYRKLNEERKKKGLPPVEPPKPLNRRPTRLCSCNPDYCRFNDWNPYTKRKLGDMYKCKYLDEDNIIFDPYK